MLFYKYKILFFIIFHRKLKDFYLNTRYFYTIECPPGKENKEYSYIGIKNKVS